MAYYYYYQQQHHAPPDPLSPGTTQSELTPLLLLPPAQQPQLALPLLAPVIPSVTSVPIKTTAVTTEHNQHQLPTPNTFIRLCEDMGLFHDLQNIVVMSSLTGQSTDSATTSVPVSTASTIVTTSTSTGQPSTSNLCGSSTTAIVTTMMMANPFDETFKQAVMQQQKSNLSENHFNNNTNDGDLNTPFITSTTDIDTSNSNNTLSMSTSTDMMTKTIVDTPASIESVMTNMTTISQPQQQNMFITTSSAEAATGNVLVMMVEQQQQQQQQHNPIISVRHQQQQHIIQQRQPQQRFIVPATTTTTSAVDTTTITVADHIGYNSEGINDNNNITNGGLSEVTTIKQVLTLNCLPCIFIDTAKTLKQNLLVKQLMHEQQKLPDISELSHNHEQVQQNNDVFISNATVQDNDNSQDDDDDDDDGCRRQQLKKKQKQELLERNRTAARRCRMKRKQRWELLSEENRKLKIENSKLREAITRLISRSYTNIS